MLDHLNTSASGLLNQVAEGLIGGRVDATAIMLVMDPPVPAVILFTIQTTGDVRFITDSNRYCIPHCSHT